MMASTMFRRLPLHGFVVLPLACIIPSVEARASMMEDLNARFEDSVRYPATLFRAMAEADNGDGRTFAAPRGHASTWVAGMWLMDETIAALKAGERDLPVHRVDGTAGYRLDRPDLQVLSCLKKDGDVTHRRTVEFQETIIELEITYPRIERVLWDPVVASVSNFLRAPGPGAPGNVG